MAIQALYDLPAPAKLNLFLHVVGRRDDGYHRLESVFQLIDWCDTLHIERRDDGQLRRTDLGVALPVDDLSLRAARALQAASGTRHGAHILIDKQLPWGAGLGGGSSDAATTLIALNRLWGLGWSRERLAGLALTLGADVPFFIGGHNAWVAGIGEQLTPIKTPHAHFMVVKPGVEMPTPQIFASPLLPRNTPASTLADFLAAPNAFGHNDLEAVARQACTDIRVACEILEQHVGPARMTGSGSAVFARLDDIEGSPAQVRQVVATVPTSWVVRECSSLECHPLAEW